MRLFCGQHAIKNKSRTEAFDAENTVVPTNISTFTVQYPGSSRPSHPVMTRTNPPAPTPKYLPQIPAGRLPTTPQPSPQQQPTPTLVVASTAPMARREALKSRSEKSLPTVPFQTPPQPPSAREVAARLRWRRRNRSRINHCLLDQSCRHRHCRSCRCRRLPTPRRGPPFLIPQVFVTLVTPPQWETRSVQLPLPRPSRPAPAGDNKGGEFRAHVNARTAAATTMDSVADARRERAAPRGSSGRLLRVI